MPEGINVSVLDDRVHVSFADPSKRGPTLAAIVKVIPPRDIRIDTGGTHKTYILPIEGAREVGLLDDIDPVGEIETGEDETPAETEPVKPKRAPRKKAEPKVETPAEDEAVSDDNAE